MKSRIIVGLVLLGAVFGIGSSVGAQQDGVYPPRPILLSLSDTTVVVDAPFTVTVTGCADGELVGFSFGSSTHTETCARSARQGLAASDVGGSASAELRAPSRAGDFEGTVSVGGANVIVTAFRIHVVDSEQILVEKVALRTVHDTPTWIPRALAIALVSSLAGLGMVTMWHVSLPWRGGRTSVLG